MELLIVSDSHGHADGISLALSRQLTPPDALCFLGDGLEDTELLALSPKTMLWTVRGNCDYGARFGDVPAERAVDLWGHRIFMTHGHPFFVKSGYGALLAHAVRIGADLVLCGHTHTPFLQTVAPGECIGGVTVERPLYLFNPGSIGSGSFGTLHLTENAVLFSHGTLR